MHWCFEGRETVARWEKPETVASAIMIGNPISWSKALRAVRDSQGQFLVVSDQEILRTQKSLASNEGIFVEPASAAPIAALNRLEKFIKGNSSVVFIATGNGLKDQSAIQFDSDRLPLVSNPGELAKYL